MTIKNLTRDPRTPEQRIADEEVLELVKAGKFFDMAAIDDVLKRWLLAYERRKSRRAARVR